MLIIAELLRHGKNLKLTDKEFYKNRVKQEFVSNREVPEDKIPYCMKQGRVFMLSKNVL